ncbi:hypothetical protein ACFX1Z_010423 [Malus domestica]
MDIRWHDEEQVYEASRTGTPFCMYRPCSDTLSLPKPFALKIPNLQSGWMPMDARPCTWLLLKATRRLSKLCYLCMLMRACVVMKREESLFTMQP